MPNKNSNVFQCHQIKNKKMISLVKELQDKFLISFLTKSKVFKISGKTPDNTEESIQIKLSFNKTKQPNKYDILGTLVAQLAAANTHKDYTDWCKYSENDPKEDISKIIYTQIIQIDLFFRLILTEEEFDKMITDCQTGGIV